MSTEHQDKSLFEQERDRANQIYAEIKQNAQEGINCNVERDYASSSAVELCNE